MGFDLHIKLVLHMCPDTGKPFYYNKDDFRKMYDISEINVPEEYRKYLVIRGHFLHVYTRVFNEEDRFEVDTSEFLDEFPSWKITRADDKYDDYWTEQDHRSFKALLKWTVQQPAFFVVSWSY